MKILAIIIFLSFNHLFADEYLISEMESLKSSLKQSDPDRVELSLRLADLYFDVSIQEGDNPNIVEYRQKSMKLYEDVLLGRDGLPAVDGSKSLKIQFQIARVAGKLSNLAKSRKYYKNVYLDKSVTKKFKRESALALAEIYEEEVDFKNANKYYLEGINLCESLDTCNYAHYKRAWLLYKEVMLDEAIVELKKSLWDSKNQAREKVINDLLLFVSASVSDGTQELKYFKDLSQKTNKPDLLRKLVEAFYAAGNRIAGSNVLEEWNKQNPSLFYEMRLVEEFYGFRNWEKFRNYLSSLEQKKLALNTPKAEVKETKAMMKRVIVQLDSESIQDKEVSKDLIKLIDIYLGLFPNDDMRRKLQQGWLKAQSSKIAKVNRLKRWIREDLAFKTESDYIRKMRQTRLAFAKDENLSDVVVLESSEIAKMVDPKTARKYLYVSAFEHYQNKNYNLALPIFLNLAKIDQEKVEVDEWALKSQHLALDIYNVEKKYDLLVAQSKKWTTNIKVNSDKSYKKDLTEMKLVQNQASFEHAASLGENKESLERFYKFCFNKTFEKKSCKNAKVLAIKLKDQPKLISLLEKEKDEKTLITEYEVMGEFSKSAKLHEKLNLKRNAGVDAYLKTALLYELDLDLKNRNKILNKLIKKLKRDKKIDKKWESALYLTFKEAKLISPKLLSLNWSISKKIEMAYLLESKNKIKPTNKILTSSLNYTGPAWAKNVINKSMSLDKKQRKISFYGRSSQYLFKKRIKALTRFNDKTVKYLEGSNLETRIYLLDILKTAYFDFSHEILSTPMPEGLTEEVLAQVQEQLKTMANPYQLAGQNFEKLQKEQILSLSAEDKTVFENRLNSANKDYISYIKDKEIKESIDIASLKFDEYQTLKKEFSKDPTKVNLLLKMENFYKKNGLNRIASYFTGRINARRE